VSTLVRALTDRGRAHRGHASASATLAIAAHTNLITSVARAMLASRKDATPRVFLG
jgi:hypothetical protein